LTDSSSVARKSAVVNSVFVLLARVVSILANTGVVLILTRYLGQGGFGQYSYIQGYVQIIAMLSLGGLPLVLIREIARSSNKLLHFLRSSLWLRSASLLAVTVVGLPLSWLLTQDVLILRGICIVTLSYLLSMPAYILSSALVAVHRANRMALSVLVERLVYCSVLAVVLLEGLDQYWILWGQVISAFVQLVFGVWLIARVAGCVPWPLECGVNKPLLRDALRLSISEGCRLASQQVGVFVLTAAGPLAAVGLFSAPQRLLTRGAMLPDSVFRGLLPTLSLLERDDHAKGHFEKSGKLLVWYTSVAASTIAAVAAPAGRQLATALFGESYAAAGPALSILSCAFIPMSAGYVLKYLFTAVGKQGQYLICLIAELIVNGCLAILLVPHLGIAGAALSLLVSQCGLCVVGLSMLFPWRSCPVQLKSILGAGAVLSGLALLARWACTLPFWPVWIVLLWGAAVVILFASNVFEFSWVSMLLADRSRVRSN